MIKVSRRKIILLSAVLAIFGFFCFFRAKLSEEYMTSADSARQSGDEQVAMENLVFADALLEKSRNPELSIKRAEILFERRDYAAAEKELRRTMKSNDKDPALYIFLGKIKFAEGDYAEAENNFATAYGLSPTTELAVLRAKNLGRAGKFSEAEAILKQAEQNVFSEDIIYYIGLVRNFSVEDFAKIRNGKYKSEIDLIEGFFSGDDEKLRTDCDYGIVSRADLFRRLGETEFALANLDVAIGHNDKYRDAYLVQGKTFLMVGEYDQARESFEKSLALDADNAEALLYVNKLDEISENPAEVQSDSR